MEKLPLTAVFEKVREALPDIVGDMQPLGHGHFGIAIGDKDKVRKILFRPDYESGSEQSLQMFTREARILQGLAGQDLGGIEVPALIKSPELIDHRDFIAAYTMSRVHGRTYPMMPENDAMADVYPDKYRNAGTLFAKFHRVTQCLPLGDAIGRGPLAGDSIIQVHSLDKDTNKKLAAADQYLQENIKGGNIHGDTHLNNVIERDGMATGLIDFSHTGYVKNRMMEFWIVPEQYSANFIEGYERESGEAVAMMAHATSLSIWTHIFRENEPLATAKIDKLLQKMSPVLSL